MAVLSTSQRIEYAGAGAPRLLLEQGRPALFGLRFDVYLYPPVAAKLAASTGTIVTTADIRTRIIARELVAFRGTDRAQTRYPPTVLTSAEPTTTLFDRDLNPISQIGAALDPETGELVISRPAYGGMLIAYQAAYRVLHYTPDTSIPRAIRYGTVLAQYQTAVEMLEIEVGTSELTQYAELYRVYSEAVADEDGLWEKPPAYPETSDYPDRPTVEGPSADESALVERTHSIGWINTFGQIFERHNYVRLAQPFVGSFVYQPVHVLRFNTSPSEEFERAFASVDQSEIRADLTVRYPNLT